VCDLLMRMLEVDNHKRISAVEALEHELFSKEDAVSSADSEPPTPLLRPLNSPV
jgi:serine/threonine protein kinase